MTGKTEREGRMISILAWVKKNQPILAGIDRTFDEAPDLWRDADAEIRRLVIDAIYPLRFIQYRQYDRATREVYAGPLTLMDHGYLDTTSIGAYLTAAGEQALIDLCRR